MMGIWQKYVYKHPDKRPAREDIRQSQATVKEAWMPEPSGGQRGKLCPAVIISYPHLLCLSFLPDLCFFSNSICLNPFHFFYHGSFYILSIFQPLHSIVQAPLSCHPVTSPTPPDRMLRWFETTWLSPMGSKVQSVRLDLKSLPQSVNYSMS